MPGLRILMIVGAMLFVGASNADAANIAANVSYKAQQKIALIEDETKDSTWLIASAVPTSFWDLSREVKVMTNTEKRDKRAKLDTCVRMLVSYGIAPTDTLMNALINRFDRERSKLISISTLRDSGLVRIDEDGMIVLTGAGDATDRDWAGQIANAENIDRAVLREEIERQVQRDEADTAITDRKAIAPEIRRNAPE